mmetsp:Transcript_1092/g.4039  ORF Transcript_1092/g.4039 Transcript_1092/m.4039 type:complete len:261 (-) Transcript_1092:179-961(-)
MVVVMVVVVVVVTGERRSQKVRALVVVPRLAHVTFFEQLALFLRDEVRDVFHALAPEQVRDDVAVRLVVDVAHLAVVSLVVRVLVVVQELPRAVEQPELLAGVPQLEVVRRLGARRAQLKMRRLVLQLRVVVAARELVREPAPHDPRPWGPPHASARGGRSRSHARPSSARPSGARRRSRRPRPSSAHTNNIRAAAAAATAAAADSHSAAAELPELQPAQRTQQTLLAELVVGRSHIHQMLRVRLLTTQRAVIILALRLR